MSVLSPEGHEIVCVLSKFPALKKSLEVQLDNENLVVKRISHCLQTLQSWPKSRSDQETEKTGLISQERIRTALQEVRSCTEKLERRRWREEEGRCAYRNAMVATRKTASKGSQR